MGRRQLEHLAIFINFLSTSPSQRTSLRVVRHWIRNLYRIGGWVTTEAFALTISFRPHQDLSEDFRIVRHWIHFLYRNGQASAGALCTYYFSFRLRQVSSELFWIVRHRIHFLYCNGQASAGALAFILNFFLSSPSQRTISQGCATLDPHLLLYWSRCRASGALTTYYRFLFLSYHPSLSAVRHWHPQT